VLKSACLIETLNVAGLKLRDSKVNKHEYYFKHAHITHNNTFLYCLQSSNDMLMYLTNKSTLDQFGFSK